MVPLRLGVAGCGRVFETSHLPAILAGNDWHWVAACDSLAHRRRWIQDRYPWVAVTPGFEDLMDRQDLDGILLATPPALHGQQVRMALAGRLPVLVEKPLLLSARPLSDLQVPDADANLVRVGFNRRFKPSYRMLRTIIRQLPDDAVRSIDVILTHDVQKWKAVTAYLEDDADGGGIWDDVLSHQIDLVHWLCGEPTVAATVYKSEGSARNPALLCYRLRLSSGRSVNCVAGHHHRFQEMVVVTLEHQTFVTLPERVIRTRRLPSRATDLINRTGSFLHFGVCRMIGRPSESAASYRWQLSAFAAAVRRGCTSNDEGAATLADGLRNAAVIQACRRSLADGYRTTLIL